MCQVRFPFIVIRLASPERSFKDMNELYTGPIFEEVTWKETVLAGEKSSPLIGQETVSGSWNEKVAFHWKGFHNSTEERSFFSNNIVFKGRRPQDSREKNRMNTTLHRWVDSEPRSSLGNDCLFLSFHSAIQNLLDLSSYSYGPRRYSFSQQSSLMYWQGLPVLQSILWLLAVPWECSTLGSHDLYFCTEVGPANYWPTHKSGSGYGKDVAVSGGDLQIRRNYPYKQNGQNIWAWKYHHNPKWHFRLLWLPLGRLYVHKTLRGGLPQKNG